MYPQFDFRPKGWECPKCGAVALPRLGDTVVFSADVKPYLRVLRNGRKRRQLGLVNCYVISQPERS